MSQVIAALAPYKGYFALGAYILITEVLAKIPKVRANTLFEVLYNPIAVLLKRNALVGKVADLLDTPGPASPATAPTASVPPSKSASGKASISILSFLIASAILLGAAILYAGCGTSYADAQKSVATLYTSIGIGVVAQKTCDRVALSQGQSGDDNGADKTISGCKVLNQCINVAENTVDGIEAGVQAAYKLGTKDYGAILAPASSALCSLNKAIVGVDPKAPVVACGGN